MRERRGREREIEIEIEIEREGEPLSNKRVLYHGPLLRWFHLRHSRSCQPMQWWWVQGFCPIRASWRGCRWLLGRGGWAIRILTRAARNGAPR